MATIEEITLADEPHAWSSLGFDVRDGSCTLGSVVVNLAGAGAREHEGPGAGLVGWRLRDIASAELDGLPTTLGTSAAPPPGGGRHPNAITAIDHVVAVSPDLDRTIATLQAAGLDLRRVREEPTPAGAPRQGFFRLDEVILEVVQEPGEVSERHGGSDRPAHFWGLALISADLDATAAAFAPHCGEVRDAVQAGRRIATVRRSAGLSVPVALMSAVGEAVA
ncbi:MAG TPA: VOC family protein [Solirubrobacteraceae bacterium]|nr:VOC family protein [Solirubrobacteraceae bacterium]